MTLIAQLAVNGAPFLVGDVLLSSETRTGLKVNLPLVGDINQILADRGLPFEVCFAQKINVFDGRVAIAWSGPLIQAERALRVIAALCSRSDLTADDVLAELRAIDGSAIDRLQLVGLVLQEVRGTTVEVSLFSLRVPPMDIPTFGQVFAAGSGRDAFLHMLQKADWQSQDSANAFQVAHGLLGALTNEEFRTGNTITNRWGGGFEALTFSEASHRFEKVGNVLHTFWKTTENLDAPIGLFPFFYKTMYWRDALVIRAVRLDISEGIKLEANDVTLIPPLLKDISDYNLDDLQVDFSYRAVCCHVEIQKASNRDILFLIDQREGGQDFFFRMDDAGVEWHVSDYLPGIIREQLMKTAATEPVGGAT
jgi:hypothetical protein